MTAPGHVPPSDEELAEFEAPCCAPTCQCCDFDKRMVAEVRRLRAELARLREAARLRLRKGHNDTCSWALHPGLYLCDCGQRILEDTLRIERGERQGEGE